VSSNHLQHVLLGCNPNSNLQSGWSSKSLRTHDVLADAYDDRGDWSIAGNITGIGPGTIGWIYRADGSFGHPAGLIAFDGDQDEFIEHGNKITYGRGWLFPLPWEWWVDGARISASTWSGRAPFGKIRRFRKGERISTADAAVLRNLLHPVARIWIDHAVHALRSVRPQRSIYRPSVDCL